MFAIFSAKYNKFLKKKVQNTSILTIIFTNRLTARTARLTARTAHLTARRARLTTRRARLTARTPRLTTGLTNQPKDNVTTYICKLGLIQFQRFLHYGNNWRVKYVVFLYLKKSVLAIKSAQKSTKKSVLAIKSAQKSTIKSKQKPQKSAQKSATKKSAKKSAKYSSNKSMRTFKSAQKSAKKKCFY